jgi:hypothetical protein
MEKYVRSSLLAITESYSLEFLEELLDSTHGKVTYLGYYYALMVNHKKKSDKGTTDRVGAVYNLSKGIALYGSVRNKMTDCVLKDVIETLLADFKDVPLLLASKRIVYDVLDSDYQLYCGNDYSREVAGLRLERGE